MCAAGWHPVSITSDPPIGSIARVDRVLADVFRRGVVTADSDGSVHQVFPVGISAGEGAGLRRWIELERPRRTLEIGLGYGLSALSICRGLVAGGRSDVRHTAIDPFQTSRFADVGLQLLKAAGVEQLVVHHAELSELRLPAMVGRADRFDFAFVDGSHRFDAVFVDLFYLSRLLVPGAVVVLDDLQLPSVARAAAFYVNNLEWTIEECSTSPEHHWIALRTSSVPDERPFGHFVDF